MSEPTENNDKNVCDEVGHDYIYERAERRHYCKHCGQNPPLDWYDIFSD